MPEPRPTISTHVLDTGRGTPAAGIRVRLWRLGQGDGGDGEMTGAATERLAERPVDERLTGRLADAATGATTGRPNERLVGEALTDADGRIRDLLAGAPLRAGQYRLEFDLEPAAGLPDRRGGEPGVAGGGFFTGLSVGLRIDDPTRSYHVPLLRAPFGLSTYRGS